MKKQIMILGLMLIFLCSCGSQGKEPSDKDDAISLQAPSTEAGEKDITQVTVTEYPLPEEVAALEKLDLMDMGLYADKEQSMRNSNQLNFGDLTTDEEGNVYFVDYTQHAIFMCGSEGEDKELLYEGVGEFLHVSNGYLYFVEIDVETLYCVGIVRVAINTKEVEVVYEGSCGELFVMQDILYNNVSGLVSMKGEEPGGEFTRLSEIRCVFFNTDGRYLLYNMVTDDTGFLSQRGYLLAWDMETETNYFVESRKVFPLLAGNWLSYCDVWTGSRHVLDLETGTDTDLGYYTQRAVSDGNKLYWVKQHTGSFQIMLWDGEEVQEFLTVEGKEGVYGDVLLYLTEDYMYWMFESDFMKEADWGYYRFSDGEMGRLN